MHEHGQGTAVLAPNTKLGTLLRSGLLPPPTRHSPPALPAPPSRWYDCRDCARWYFRSLATRLLEELCGGDLPATAAAAAAAGEAGAAADPPAGAAAAAGQAQQGQQQQPAIGDEEREILAALVDSEYGVIAQIVLLESRGNDEVPQLFLDAVPPDAQPDQVDLCSEDEDEGGAAAARQQQPPPPPPQQQQQQQQQQPAAAAVPAAQEEPA